MKKSSIESRITRGSKVQTAPVARKTKEEASDDLVQQVLKASEKLAANISKSGKGKCVVIEITGCQELSKLTCLVFNGSGITVIAEKDPKDAIFNVAKRNFDSVENAAKFIRCAFVKSKQQIALCVPTKATKREA